MRDDRGMWEAWCPECPEGHHILGISGAGEGIAKQMADRHRSETGHIAQVREMVQEAGGGHESRESASGL